MVKGLARRIILIKSPDSDIFEEAIFLVKEEALSKGVNQKDIIRQAQAVANEYIKTNTKKKAIRSLPPYVIFVSGAILTGLIWLVTIIL